MKISELYWIKLKCQSFATFYNQKKVFLEKIVVQARIRNETSVLGKNMLRTMLQIQLEMLQMLITQVNRVFYFCRTIYLQNYISVDLLLVEMRGKFLRMKFCRNIFLLIKSFLFYRYIFLPEKVYRNIVLQLYMGPEIYCSQKMTM